MFSRQIERLIGSLECPTCEKKDFATDHSKAEKVCRSCFTVIDLTEEDIENPVEDEAEPITPAALEIMADRLNLNKYMKDRATWIFNTFRERGLMKGRTQEDIMAGALLAVCREEGIGLFPTDYRRMRREENNVIQAYKVLLQAVPGLKRTLPVPKNYIPRLCNELQLPYVVEVKAKGIASNVNGRASSKDPLSIAAGAVYIASILLNDRRTQTEIRSVSGTTEVAIRSAYTQISRDQGLSV